MNNSNDKNEAETIKFKKVPIGKYYKDKNYKSCQVIVLIALISCIFIFLVIFYFIYKKVNESYLSQLQEKENIIENLKEQLNNLNSSQHKEGKKKFTPIEKEFLYDKNFYMLNKMYASKDNRGNGNGYNIILNTHTLEKGLSHFELRPFGKQKIKIIIGLLKKQLDFANYERLFSFINGINSLREYKKVYDQHKWTNQPEYQEVTEFLIKYEKIIEQKTGAYVMTKEELKNDYDIDYNKFIKSRHSTRNYKNYYSKGKMRQNVIDYSIGKGGLYLEGVNTFILTFDTNGLTGAGERNQGYFNAGLFSTNFVNALHSLGIGTCFIQFANSVEEEEKLKKLNEIPSSERIAVILYAGYYDDKSIFCVSPRKDFEDYFTLHE